MSVTVVTRGSALVFTAAFFDVDGVQVNPPSATLRISYYKQQNIFTIDEIPLVQQSNNNWTGSWDSSVCEGGKAHWHVRSTGTYPAAEEGDLDLEVNPANPSWPTG